MLDYEGFQASIQIIRDFYLIGHVVFDTLREALRPTQSRLELHDLLLALSKDIKRLFIAR